MSKSIKRVLAMLMTVCMVVGMMPTMAFADEAKPASKLVSSTYRGENILASAEVTGSLANLDEMGQEVRLTDAALIATDSKNYPTSLAADTEGSEVTAYKVASGDASTLKSLSLSSDIKFDNGDSLSGKQSIGSPGASITDNAVTVADGDYVIIQVDNKDESGSKYTFYLLRIKKQSNESGIESITVKGEDVKDSTGQGSTLASVGNPTQFELTSANKVTLDAGTARETEEAPCNIVLKDKSGRATVDYARIYSNDDFTKDKTDDGKVNLTDLPAAGDISNEKSGALVGGISASGGTWWIVIHTTAEDKTGSYTVVKVLVKGTVATVSDILINNTSIGTLENKKESLADAKEYVVSLPYIENAKRAKSTLVVKATTNSVVKYKISSTGANTDAPDQSVEETNKADGQYKEYKVEELALDSAGGYLNILVRSNDGTGDADASVKNYYKVRYTWQKNTSVALNKVKVADAEKTVGAGGSVNNPTSVKVEVPYRKGGLNSVNVTLYGPANAKVKGVFATSTPASSAWPTTGATMTGGSYSFVGNLSAGNHLYVELSAEDGTPVYYDITAEMSAAENDAALKKVEIIDGDNTYGFVGTIPAPGTIIEPAEVIVKVPKAVTLSGVKAALTVSKYVNSVSADASASAVYNTPLTVVDPKIEKDGKEWVATTDNVDLDSKNSRALYVKIVAQDTETIGYYKVIVESDNIVIDESYDTPNVTPEDVTGVVAKGSPTEVAKAVNATNIDNAKTKVQNLAYAQAMEKRGSNDNWDAKYIEDEFAKKGVTLVPGEETFIHIGAYLDVDVVSYDNTKNAEKYVVDLTPRYYVAASTVSTDATNKMIFPGKGIANSIYLIDNEKIENLKNVEVTFGVPNDFGKATENVYVQHENETSLTRKALSGDPLDPLTIEAKSFSKFTVTKTPGTVQAQIGDVYYATVQEALDALKDVEAPRTVTLTAYANGHTANLKAPVTGTDDSFEFTINPDTNNTGIKLNSISFVDNPATDGYTYRADYNEKTGAVTVTREVGGSVEPSGPDEPNGKLEFVDAADAEELQDELTTVGTEASARFTLNMKAEDGTELDDVANWDVKAADTKIVHVTAKKKLRFNNIGETTVTVTANSKDGSKTYETTFPVKVTGLGAPVITVTKGKGAKTIKVKTKKVYGASEIVVRYSLKSDLDSNLKGSKKKTYTSKMWSAKTIKVNKSKKTYYVKARAIGSDGEKSGWSEVDNVKTK